LNKQADVSLRIETEEEIDKFTKRKRERLNQGLHG
jgi:hypothetical protein